MQLTRLIAQEILDGSKSPYTGAMEISAISSDYKQANIPLVFVGLASEYGEFGDYQHLAYYGKEHCDRVLEEIENQILEEAQKLTAE